LVATLPPMVDHGALAGSGGYHRPCRATAARSSSFTTPGCTTASRSAASICTISRIASRLSTTQPCTALAPPESPVPAPLGTTGTPSAAHARTVAATSAVALGRTTAAGSPNGAHSASSCRYRSVSPGSVSTRSAGSTAPSADTMGAGPMPGGRGSAVIRPSSSAGPDTGSSSAAERSYPE
jgi:hypothetical protein